MKPNDKAYKEFMRVYNKTHVSLEAQIMASLTAAYAAQFPPSEDYAELIETLRSSSPYTLSHVAADVLEALLAERDTLKSKLKTMTENWEEAVKTNSKLCHIHLKERDALLARLAPVDDEALVEIATREIFIERRSLASAIAAIRPHIEAAERGRCAAALEITSDEIRLHAGEMTAQEMRSVLSVLTWRAAAIRSGSGK